MFWHWLLSWNAIPLCFPDVFATSKPSKTIVFHVLWCNILKTIIFVVFENMSGAGRFLWIFSIFSESVKFRSKNPSPAWGGRSSLRPPQEDLQGYLNKRRLPQNVNRHKVNTDRSDILSEERWIH